MQNAPIGKFTALTATTFMTISVFKCLGATFKQLSGIFFGTEQNGLYGTELFSERNGTDFTERKYFRNGTERILRNGLFFGTERNGILRNGLFFGTERNGTVHPCIKGLQKDTVFY